MGFIIFIIVFLLFITILERIISSNFKKTTYRERKKKEMGSLTGLVKIQKNGYDFIIQAQHKDKKDNKYFKECTELEKNILRKYKYL